MEKITFERYSMRSKKLFFITDTYNGDFVFFEDEIKELSQYYDITIISSHGVEELEKEIDIPCCFYGKRTREIRWVRFFVKFWLVKNCRGEVKEIVKTKRKIFARIFDSIVFYCKSEEFYEYLAEHFDFNDSLVYTYWNTYNTLACMLHKNDLKYHKIISRIHRYDLYDEVRKCGRQPFKPYMNANIDNLLFIGEEPMQYYISRHPEVLFKARLMRLGTQALKVELCNRSEKFVLVSCSSIDSVKRVNLIIETLALLEDIEIEWIHFGDGKLRDNICDLAKERLDLKSNIKYKFMGQTNNNDIRKFYESGQAALFITTSESEGAPVSIMEALAAGIPILATDVGDIPVMVDGNGILLSKDSTAEEFADGINRIYEHWNCADYDAEKIYMTMRQQSYNIWCEKFDSARNVISMVDFVRNVDD